MLINYILDKAGAIGLRVVIVILSSLLAHKLLSLLKNNLHRDFPGGPVVKTPLLPLQGAQV